MNDRDFDSSYQTPDGHLEVKFARQGDIVFSTVIGMLTSQDADELTRIYRDWLTKVGKPFRHVMDVNQLIGEEPAARKKMQRLSGGTDSPFARFAIFGGSFAQRAMFNMYSMVSRVPMKMFETKDQAMAWIMEE